MAKNYIPTKNLSRTEWLEARKETGLGGSEVAAVLGYHPYKTAVDVWIEKTASSVIETPDNEAMWIGRRIEPMLRDRFEHEKNLRVYQDHKIRIHPEYDCLFCNLDGMIINPDEGTGVFEAKAFLSYELDKYESIVPPHSYLQVMHNMAVCGYDYGYIIIWVKDRNEFIIQRINRNEQLIEDMNQRSVRFWEYNVQEHNAPAPANEDDLKNLYTPGSEGKAVTATEDIYEQWRELNKVRAEQKALENKEDILRFQIESFMEDAEVLKDEHGDILITWKTPQFFNKGLLEEHEPELFERYCTKFDKSEFKKDHAAKYDKYKERTGSRRFLPKTK